MLRKDALGRILRTLSTRERRVLELRYGLNGEQPRTLDEVGRAFNVTRERIRQIENQCLKKLRAVAEAKSRSATSPRFARRKGVTPLRRASPFCVLRLLAPWMRRFSPGSESGSRILSISADAAHAADVRLAGEWLCAQIRAAGGDAELADWEGYPLALGELRATAGADSAPTVLCYGHFDVQPPDPLELWETPPFEATVRDGQVFGRGKDDGGQLFPLQEVAVVFARARDTRERSASRVTAKRPAATRSSTTSRWTSAARTPA